MNLGDKKDGKDSTDIANSWFSSAPGLFPMDFHGNLLGPKDSTMAFAFNPTFGGRLVSTLRWFL